MGAGLRRVVLFWRNVVPCSQPSFCCVICEPASNCNSHSNCCRSRPLVPSPPSWTPTSLRSNSLSDALCLQPTPQLLLKVSCVCCSRHNSVCKFVCWLFSVCFLTRPRAPCVSHCCRQVFGRAQRCSPFSFDRQKRDCRGHLHLGLNGHTKGRHGPPWAAHTLLPVDEPTVCFCCLFGCRNFQTSSFRSSC